MNDDTDSSVLDSAMTQPSDLRDQSRSEAEAIQWAAAEARRAARATWGDLNRCLQECVDPRLLTRSHPWLTLGIASVVGFAAGTEVASRNSQSGLNDSPVPSGSERSGESAFARPTSAHIWANRFFDLAKVAISSGIAAAMQSQATSSHETSAPS